MAESTNEEREQFILRALDRAKERSREPYISPQQNADDFKCIVIWLERALEIGGSDD